MNYVDGKKQGIEIGFYENGKKEYEINFVDGKEQGLKIGFFESG
jgi:antitoxin component YwqK of YwqJK toxin-antitoxin module